MKKSRLSEASITLHATGENYQEINGCADCALGAQRGAFMSLPEVVLRRIFSYFHVFEASRRFALITKRLSFLFLSMWEDDDIGFAPILAGVNIQREVVLYSAIGRFLGISEDLCFSKREVYDRSWPHFAEAILFKGRSGKIYMIDNKDRFIHYVQFVIPWFKQEEKALSFPFELVQCTSADEFHSNCYSQPFLILTGVTGYNRGIILMLDLNGTIYKRILLEKNLLPLSSCMMERAGDFFHIFIATESSTDKNGLETMRTPGFHSTMNFEALDTVVESLNFVSPSDYMQRINIMRNGFLRLKNTGSIECYEVQIKNHEIAFARRKVPKLLSCSLNRPCGLSILDGVLYFTTYIQPCGQRGVFALDLDMNQHSLLSVDSDISVNKGSHHPWDLILLRNEEDERIIISSTRGFTRVPLEIGSTALLPLWSPTIVA